MTIALANAYPTSDRALAAWSTYQAIPETTALTREQGEQDAFTTGWDAAVHAVLAEFRALDGPATLLRLSGLSIPYLDAVDRIAQQFGAEQ